ncbi:hypothetical protein O3M35_006924 [Rhynocoris fuscipes]|uniref:Uncharacterized protein n=1 Tax=Rhynocoris fuscipes TaxID=488301 RepID=A0AAW1DHX8_9HEMI
MQGYWEWRIGKMWQWIERSGKGYFARLRVTPTSKATSSTVITSNTESCGTFGDFCRVIKKIKKNCLKMGIGNASQLLSD